MPLLSGEGGKAISHMNTTLILIGIGCIIGAIIGGGVKLVQIELSPVTSLWRQMLLGCFGIVLVISGVIAGKTGPAAAPPPTVQPANASDYIIPDSQNRRLTAGDLAKLSAAQLRIARNEIYARHGFRFKSADLAAYFSKMPWYTPLTDTVSLSPIEQANVELIGTYEKSAG
jgi:hypothetical protein